MKGCLSGQPFFVTFVRMTKLTFLGTGTSQGVPVIGCGCHVCTSPDSRDKRLRTSAMIEKDGVRIIIDAGPDFRQQMLREGVSRIDGILLTHEHKDHIAGIDDVRAFNYTSRGAVDIYAAPQVQEIVRKDFDYAFAENPYPGAPVINLVTIDPHTPFSVKGLEVMPIAGLHSMMPVMGFRIGGIAYITDFNYIAPEEIDKIKGVEILIINALREKRHLSHFTLSEALAISNLVKPQRTYLTHVSHEMGRHAEALRILPANTFLAYDGLVVESED